MPGSYGEVTRSLCFDAACNSQKVALWRKAQRDAQAAGDEAAGKGATPLASEKRKTSSEKTRTPRSAAAASTAAKS